MLHWLLKQAYTIKHKNKVNILIYHKVLDKPDPMRPSEPTTEVFDWQMRLLSKYFTPISLSEAVEGLKNNRLPKNAVVVTFDDGYINNLTLAQPILEKYQVPATFYIATGFSNGSNMWNDRIIHLFANKAISALQLDDETIQLGDDDDRRTKAYAKLKALKYIHMDERVATVNRWYAQNKAQEQARLMMNKEELIQFSQRPGVTLGAHTVDHPILKNHSIDEQRTQIKASKDTLETLLTQPVEHFAYPNGSWGTDLDENAVALVRELGFKSAVITNWGKADSKSDLFTLPRFTPWDSTELKFHLRLLLQR